MATGAASAPVTVGTGEGTVSETAGTGTNLADYDSSVECTRNGRVESRSTGTMVDGAVARGDAVVCTFHESQEGNAPDASASRLGCLLRHLRLRLGLRHLRPPPGPPPPPGPAPPRPSATTRPATAPGTTARPRGHEDRHEGSTRRRRRADHVDDDGYEPVIAIRLNEYRT